MFLVRFFGQITIAIASANLILSIFLHLKVRNPRSRSYMWLIILHQIQLLAPQTAYIILSALYPDMKGLEYLVVIAYSVVLVTVPLISILSARLYYYLVDDPIPAYLKIGTILVSILSVVSLGIAFITRSSLEHFYHITFLIILGTGVFQILTVGLLYVSFRRNVPLIPSPLARTGLKAGFVFFFLAIPALFTYVYIDDKHILRSMNLHTYMVDNMMDVFNSKKLDNFLVPYLYHLVLHAISLFMIARFFFKPGQNMNDVLDEKFCNKYGISNREKEVCQLILKGLSNKEICRRLFIAEGTLRNHVTNIYQKCEVHTRIEFSYLVKREYSVVH